MKISTILSWVWRGKRRKSAKRKMFIRLPPQLKDEKGLSLIEVIIASFVLLVGVLSIMVLLVQSMQDLHVAKNRAIGANLAQEGIAVVRAIRDNNWIQHKEYDNGLNETTNGCVDYDDLNLQDPCPDTAIYWDGSKYNHDNGEETGFRRHIELQKIQNPEDNPEEDPDPPYLEVISVVTWDEGEREMIVEDHLYDWR